MLPTFADGRYQALHPIGAGGSAVVYCVHDLQLEVKRAVKMLNPHALISENIRERVLREARITAKINHPHVITVHDSFIEQGLPCIVMELAFGSLADWVRIHGPLSPAQASPALLGVLDALQVAHDLGIIHRDIKPQNLLIGPTGDLKLADFGIAHHLADSKVYTQTGAVMGSFAYMSPEQRQSAKAATEPADIYAIAATLVWALTGRSPMDLCVQKPREEMLAGLPDELSAVIRKASSYDQEARYPSAATLRAALASISEQLGESPQPLEPIPLGEVSADSLATAMPSPWGGSSQPEAAGPALSLGLAIGVGGVVLLSSAAAWWAGGAGAAEDAANWSLKAKHAAEIQDMPYCFPAKSGASVAPSYSGYSYPRSRIQGPTPREARDLTSGDFNNDGEIDLAIYHLLDEVVHIYWGPGFWTLETNTAVAAYTEIPMGRLTKQIAAGDFNGDGQQDILGIRSEGGTAVVVAYGSVEPERWDVQAYDEADVPGLPLAVDWNEDGISDVLFSQRINTDLLFLRLGSREAGLLPAVQLGNGAPPYAVGRLSEHKGPQMFSVSPGGQVYRSYQPTLTSALQTELLFRAPAPTPWGSIHFGTQGGQPALYLSAGTHATLVYTQDDDGSWIACASSRGHRQSPISHFTDLNNDGNDEAIMLKTCGYCTSQYIVQDFTTTNRKSPPTPSIQSAD